MAEALAALVRANVAASLAILLVLAVRKLTRRRFGAEAAYLLWIVPPFAALASLVPSRTVAVLPDPPAPGAWSAFVPPAAQLGSGGGAPAVLLAVWLGGVALSLLMLAAVQVRFLARVRRREAGPAVVGFILPRMVTPADYEEQFTPDERAVVRAHERVHIDRQDPRANALAAALQAVNWFNPLVHLAAGLMRLDQELACDAAVIRRYPQVRRRYAETLLKTQLGARVLPLGCHWGPSARHPLEERIAMLAKGSPRLAVRGVGVALVLGMTWACGLAAWAAKPVRAAGPSFYAVERPQLWSVEVEGQTVQICTDATVRIGFARPTPVFGDAPCPPDAIPVSHGGGFAFQCEVAGKQYDVTSVVRGDRAADFTTDVVVAPHGGVGQVYRQTRRHKLVGACPQDWIIGDQSGRDGAMTVNSISVQRAL